MKSIVVLLSGRGTNLQALLGAPLAGARVCAVISNRAAAEGLEVATRHGIPTRVVAHDRFDTREAFDAALADAIDGFAPDLLVLAGFMRKLTNAFVHRYAGKMLNVHPSLLPAFTGLHTHRRALEAGVRVHGATIHFVTPELDAGPIVIQAVVPVLEHDDEAALASRVLEQEHRIYPQAVRWFVTDRLRITENGRVLVTDAPQQRACCIFPPLEHESGDVCL